VKIHNDLQSALFIGHIFKKGCDFMPAPVLSVLILIFIVWLQYEIRKASRLDKSSTDNFWEKEKQSNLTRRKDISQLDYIILKLESLPLEDKEDLTVNSYRDTILKLSDKKILNLSGYTNTDLKTMYGPANMKLLTEYDGNFITLISMLQKWAERLYADGYTEDAKSVLEFAVSHKTDVTRSYRLLAEIYKLQNTPEKINGLIQSISETATIHDKDN
jgi:hypothetical protein